MRKSIYSGKSCSTAKVALLQKNSSTIEKLRHRESCVTAKVALPRKLRHRESCVTAKVASPRKNPSTMEKVAPPRIFAVPQQLQLLSFYFAVARLSRFLLLCNFHNAMEGTSSADDISASCGGTDYCKRNRKSLLRSLVRMGFLSDIYY